MKNIRIASINTVFWFTVYSLFKGTMLSDTGLVIGASTVWLLAELFNAMDRYEKC